MTEASECRAALLRDLEDLDRDHRLTPDELEAAAARHNVPPSEVLGLRTFYFPDRPPGALQVCTGLPCALRRSTASPSPDLGERTSVACLGYCSQAPVVARDGRFFTEGLEGLQEIAESTLEFVDAHLERLAAYRSRGGYGALGRCLVAPDADAILQRIEGAALRGMGGAGFPAHVKWRAVRTATREDRVLLVNAHEGEPATFKDRELLEREPHRLLEGALIAALTVGAPLVVIGLKSDYRHAARSLATALEEFRTYAATAWPSRALPRVEVRTVPGPYVTGEETALMEALEGRRSEPRLRPPFPAEAGLEGRPTLVQNVETLATLPHLLLGEESGPSLGRPEKVYCLTGDVARPGAYRHPLGVPALRLVEDDGGTPRNAVKAFFPGGLSGGLLPASRLGVPLEFDAVRREGSGLGTGAVIVIGRDRCLREVLSQLADFFASESCGKCVPCRLGTQKLRQYLASVRDGTAREEDLEAAIALARLLQETSICALGQVAGKALVDAARYFPEEFRAHPPGACPGHRPEQEAAP